jgi:hypothetical protein
MDGNLLAAIAAALSIGGGVALVGEAGSRGTKNTVEDLTKKLAGMVAVLEYYDKRIRTIEQGALQQQPAPQQAPVGGDVRRLQSRLSLNESSIQSLEDRIVDLERKVFPTVMKPNKPQPSQRAPAALPQRSAAPKPNKRAPVAESSKNEDNRRTTTARYQPAPPPVYEDPYETESEYAPEEDEDLIAALGGSTR